MTSAERAKELYDQFSKLTDEDWAAMTEEDFLQRLTQAITQAQNDKLEEAAAVVSSAAFLAGMNDRGPRYVRDLGDIASNIRSLKSKD